MVLRKKRDSSTYNINDTRMTKDTYHKSRLEAINMELIYILHITVFG